MGFEQLAELKKQLTKEAAQQAGAAQRRPKDTGGSKAKPAANARPAANAKPAANARPEANAKPAANAKTAAKARLAAVDPVVLVIGKLQKRFPAAFPKSPAPKIPLKVGILEDVLAHADQLG